MIEKDQKVKLEKGYQSLDAMKELINQFTTPIKFGNISTQGKWGSALREENTPYPTSFPNTKIHNLI